MKCTKYLQLPNIILLLICAIILLPLSVFAQSYNIIGSVLTTDIKAYINGYEIPAYNVDGNMVIVGSDLRNYGFNVVYDNNTRTSSVSLNLNGAWSPLDVSSHSVGNIGTKVMDVYDTDISVLLNGMLVTSYNVNGNMAFKFSELKMFGSYYYDNFSRTTNLWIDLTNLNNEPQYDITEYSEDDVNLDGHKNLNEFSDKWIYVNNSFYEVDNVFFGNWRIYYDDTGIYVSPSINHQGVSIIRNIVQAALGDYTVKETSNSWSSGKLYISSNSEFNGEREEYYVDANTREFLYKYSYDNNIIEISSELNTDGYKGAKKFEEDGIRYLLTAGTLHLNIIDFFEKLDLYIDVRIEYDAEIGEYLYIGLY
ncbi:MAG: hypothetical protein IKU40_12330 [Clostridia bacterium]|nr:hypothetical protein [Clostridia bacterium]